MTFCPYIQGMCETWTHFTCRHNLDVCTVLDALLFCRMQMVALFSRNSARTGLIGLYKIQCSGHTVHTSWEGALSGSDNMVIVLSWCLCDRHMPWPWMLMRAQQWEGRRATSSVISASSLNNCLCFDHKASFIKALVWLVSGVNSYVIYSYILLFLPYYLNIKDSIVLGFYKFKSN